MVRSAALYLFNFSVSTLPSLMVNPFSVFTRLGVGERPGPRLPR